MHRMLLTLFLTALGLIGVSESLRAEGVGGVYTLPSPSGALTLTLQEAAGGAVGGTLVGYDGTTYRVEGVQSVDEDGESSVDGTLSHPQGQGRFTLTIDEDDDVMVTIVPLDAFGNPDHASTVVYAAIRGAGQGAPSSPAPSSPAQQADGDHDPRLVGVWAYQDIMSGQGITVASQLVMQFHPDGTLVQGDGRTMASGAWFGMDSSQGGAVEQGQWRTDGGILYAAMAGSPWVALAQYQVSGTSLLLVYGDGSRQLWHRQ